MKKLMCQAKLEPRNHTKPLLKPIKRGIVVICRSNIGDFMCFLRNLTKNDVKNDVK